MTLFHMAIRGLKFHFRNHLGVLLGVALSTAVIVGALLVGDSLRYSLKKMGEERLMDVRAAIVSQDRFFRDALADDLSLDGRYDFAPALFLPASGANSAGDRRVNKVQVVGVEDRFWKLGRTSTPFKPALGDRQVVLNDVLARQLGVEAGDNVVLRVANPSLMPRDAPFSTEEDVTLAVRAEVAAVVGPEQFGRFSLQASQRPAATAFVPLSYLQKRLELPGKANVMLTSEAYFQEPSGGWDELAAWHPPGAPGESLFSLADASLELVDIPGQNAWELRTDRVFIDDLAAAASKATGLEKLRVVTYFGNAFSSGTNVTPFSMIAGLEGESFLPDDLDADEAVINQWVAEDLGIAVGDSFDVKYYVIGNKRTLEERTHRFKVRAVVPLEGLAADKELMPNLPGITDSEDCGDWEPGMPLDLKKIREKDEKYWDEYRGTPKAFIRLDVGQKLWTNRFGSITAIRYDQNTHSREEVEAAILKNMKPTDYGLGFIPVGDQARKAGAEGLDLGQYFAYFSFFIIVAALALGGMLFLFGVEQRRDEIAALFAMGYRSGLIRKLLFREGAVVVVLGSVLGISGGVLYTLFLLKGLSGAWNGAVGISGVVYHGEVTTMIMGALIGLAVGLFVLWWALWRFSRKGISQLFAGTAPAPSDSKKAAGLLGAASGLALAAAVGCVVAGGEQHAGAFFGAGALVLIAGLCWSARYLRKLVGGNQQEGLDMGRMGIRQAGRNRGRSLMAIGTLASGIFMVIGVGAFHQGEQGIEETQKRSAGTGGFAYMAETAQAIYSDLNDPGVREKLLLEEETFSDVHFVQLRVREGEEASCLNLNKAQRPQVLGVNPAALAGRFSFVKTVDGSEENPWALLAQGPDADGAIPAIADNNSIMYALMSGVGETLDYMDEQGNTVKLKLVGGVKNSILQGSILIAEDQFVRLFPSASGYRQVLMDVPREKWEAVEGQFRKNLREVGPELVSTRQRLAEYNAVQNTYISVFQALGGLGVLLGSIGLAVIVLRNVLERRQELGVLEAMGYQKKDLRFLVLREHNLLLAAGLLVGALAALMTMIPYFSELDAQAGLWMVGSLAGLGASGLFWIWLSTRFALRSRVIDAMRND